MRTFCSAGYLHLSDAHPSRITAEFNFRGNIRSKSDAKRDVNALMDIEGKRLTTWWAGQAANR
jgi:hypothetical protein